MSRKSLVALVVAGFLTDSALAGSTATVTPMGGSIGQPFNNGTMHGFSYNFAKGGPAGIPRNLYDNIPSIFGGSATAGFFTTAGGAVVTGTFVFTDWVSPLAQWSDDLHGISAGGPGPAVVTNIWYSYFNSVATSTHVIKLYDMLPPFNHAVTTLIMKGARLASIVVPNLPLGTFTVTVPVGNVLLPNSAVWINFEEQGLGAPYTFWLTGGVPGIGYSHPGVLYNLKNYFPDGSAYSRWLPFDYFYFGALGYVASNISVGLNGFHIPGPAAISLLGLGGLVALRRRRR